MLLKISTENLMHLEKKGLGKHRQITLKESYPDEQSLFSFLNSCLRLAKKLYEPAKWLNAFLVLIFVRHGQLDMCKVILWAVSWSLLESNIVEKNSTRLS